MESNKVSLGIETLEMLIERLTNLEQSVQKLVDSEATGMYGIEKERTQQIQHICGCINGITDNYYKERAITKVAKEFSVGDLGKIKEMLERQRPSTFQ
jgi:hypothetical protein